MNLIKAYFFLALNSACLTTFGQRMEFDPGLRIRVQLIDSVIEIHREASSFDLNVMASNKSDVSYILYSFLLTEEGDSNEKYYKDKRNVGRTAVFIFTVDRQQVRLGVRDAEGQVEHRRAMTTDSVQSIYNRSKSLMDRGKVIIKQGEEKMIKLEVRLGLKKLIPGTYRIFIIYYCGENIYNYFSQEKIFLDEVEFDAVMYQGFAKSNAIRLIVN